MAGAGRDRRSRAGRWWPGLVLPVVLFVLASQARAEDEVFSYRDGKGVMHFTNVPTDRRFRAFAAPRQRATLLEFRKTRRSSAGASSPADVSPEMRRLITETALRFDLEPALVHAVVRAESGFDPHAVSSAGARGLMQLMPSTASEVGVRDVFHPRDNLEGGVSYLRGLLERHSGNVQLALAAYNAGPSSVEEYGGVPPFPETREYLRRVFRFRQEYLRERLRERNTAESNRMASR